MACICKPRLTIPKPIREASSYFVFFESRHLVSEVWAPEAVRPAAPLLLPHSLRHRGGQLGGKIFFTLLGFEKWFEVLMENCSFGISQILFLTSNLCGFTKYDLRLQGLVTALWGKNRSAIGASSSGRFSMMPCLYPSYATVLLVL